MKLFMAIMILAYGFPAFSQEGTIQKKIHLVSIGYGYNIDAHWWEKEISKINFDPPGSTNVLYLDYEYVWKKKIGVGLSVGFIKVDKDKFGVFAPLFETYAYIAEALRIMPSISYHFLNNSKLDPYVNFEIGYYRMTTQLVYYSFDPNPLNSLGFLSSPLVRSVVKKSTTNGINISGGAGLRYLFSKHLGVFAEAGINRSIFKTGLAIYLLKNK